ncbi:Two-component response regulator-like [Actinidia chinensis var. chinensis]|uniref:Two-component response regulator-like n=1 Tax=Actinidia chinensis var. chinensis TaxID=1590841 RepID=A0A2R6PF41_ACTCC|nr:Two-component response regulator-like [Actinidia chinensis var. chinensis]
MGPVPKKNASDGDGYLAEENKDSLEHKEVQNIVVAEGQGLGSYEGDESRINEVAEEITDRPERAIQVSSGPQQLQFPGPVVHWDRFLPIRSLKVLLVENDDCTRHVVSALLRNCSYEVIAVSNGLQAWKILEDFNNHTDLVLTEVVMPFLSGIGLLCKIMSHKTFKNIPVIMMSSHDSMGLVFKCLSRGAVDFLVKPIRKNELKNLWQHVWRRCHSSSGSGSESGTHNANSTESKSSDEIENHTGSSDEQDNGSIGLSIRDGSDNGSGTQSSWKNKTAEVDSPQPISPRNQLADARDSTCAQVIHTKPETSISNCVHITESEGFQEHDEQLAMGRDLEIGTSRDPNSQLEYQYKFSNQHSSKKQNKLSEPDSLPVEKEKQELKSENISGKLRDHAESLSKVIGISIEPQAESRALEAPSGFSGVSQLNDKARSDFKESSCFELTLKKLREVGDVGTSLHGDLNVLRHSDQSAFSKYNAALSTNQVPMGNVGSSSPLHNSSVAMKTEAMHGSNCTLPNQRSNVSSKNIDAPAPRTKYVLKPETLSDNSESVSAFKCFHTSALQPMPNGLICKAQQVIPEKVDDVAVGTDEVQERGSNRKVQVQHHHHHYHHHHHHVHNMQHQPHEDRDDFSQKNMAAASPQCGSTNMLGGFVEGNVVMCSVNGSASGSNYGSNGKNGSGNALHAGVKKMESNSGAAGKNGVIVSGRVGGNGADEDRLALREAALTKFRQKRKERCFEKKVRYHGRKKMAEQRPRIRGQFVRQIAYEMSDKKAGKDRQDNIAHEDNSCDSIQ